MYQLDEGTRERGVILDFDHAPHRAKNNAIGVGKLRPRPDARLEFSAVDTVVNLVQLARRHTDCPAQPGFEIAAHRDVVRHQRPCRATQQVVFPVLAIQVEHVASMLAMHRGTYAGGGGHELRFQCGQIAGVHQIGFELAQQFP
jgi:hypothetical protein